MNAQPHDVTQLLQEMQQGSAAAGDRLLRVVYDQLHRLAEHYMRGERAGHTLQPTALVNEAWMRLAGGHDSSWQSRSHFFGVAAQAMRRILVDHARRRQARRREGGVQVTLDDAMAVQGERSIDLIALDDALQRLAALNPRQAQVVELRYFGGLDVDETAEVLGIAAITVKRDWAFAKAWLYRALDAADPPAEG